MSLRVHPPHVALLAVVLGMMFMGSTGTAHGATFSVNSTADAVDAAPGDGVCDDGAGNCTVRAAIGEANSLVGPDTITVPAGIYTLTSGTRLDISLSPLTINGAGSDQTFIQAAESPASATSGVFLVKSPVVLSGVTVRHGNSSGDAGGIFNASFLSIIDSVVTRNSAAMHGGGITNSFFGTLMLTNTEVSENVAGRFGGGISTSGTTTISNSVVANNVATVGGGISGAFHAVNISHSTVRNNSANETGGGISNSGHLNVVGSSIEQNAAFRRGGGVYDTGDSATITDSTIHHNTSNFEGAGIFAISNGILRIVNSTISNNTGDGINVNDGAEVELSHVTVTENTTGVRTFRGGLTLTGSIIAGNGPPSGFDCISPVPVPVFSFGPGSSLFIQSVTSLGHNLIGDGTLCETLNEAEGDLIGTETSPIDPVLGPLADNGGPTKTHALLPGSPGIDHVPVVDCVDPGGNPITTDQRGVVRPQGAGCDIGAFELIPAAAVPSVSQWGLTGLAVVLAGLAYLRLVRRASGKVG